MPAKKLPSSTNSAQKMSALLLIIKILGLLSLFALASLYILSFILNAQYAENLPGAYTLLLASPTIPVLFLFALLVPAGISYLKKQKEDTAVFIALFITVIVLIAASLLFGNGDNNLNSIAFYAGPSLFAGGVLFLYYWYVQFFSTKLSLFLSLLTGLLVTPFTGIRVVFAYYDLVKSFGGKDLFSWGSESSLPSSFTQPTFILLLILYLIIFCYFRKSLKTMAFLFNLIFVIGVLIYVYIANISGYHL